MMLLHRSRSVGSSSGLWLPTTDNVKRWYDAQDLTTMFTDVAGTTPVTANGDLIARWNDKGSDADHAHQVASGDRPTYRTSSNINSKAAVRCPGGANPNAGMDMAGNWGALNEVMCNGAMTSVQAFAGTAQNVDITNTKLLVIQWVAGAGSGTAKFFGDGTQVGSTTTGLTLADSGIFAVPVNMLSAGNFSFGRLVSTQRLFNRNTEGRAGDGDFGDLIYFDTQSDALRQKVEGYLAHKYGTTLPGGHPYAVSPP